MRKYRVLLVLAVLLLVVSVVLGVVAYYAALEASENFLGCTDVSKRVIGGMSLLDAESRLVAVITSEPYNYKLDDSVTFFV